jgi:hypothetical protein
VTPRALKIQLPSLALKSKDSFCSQNVLTKHHTTISTESPTIVLLPIDTRRLVVSLREWPSNPLSQPTNDNNHNDPIKEK